MENTNTTAPVIGQRREGVKTKEVFGEDAWQDTPFYAYTPTGDVGSEHLLPWSIGMSICANFHVLRRTKNENENKRRDYACFITDDGQKLRAYVSGQLRAALERLDAGTYVEMTYRGKEYVESQKQELHQFDIVIPEDANINVPLKN